MSRDDNRTTLRECLTKAGLDWNRARILYQPVIRPDHLDDHEEFFDAPGWPDNVGATREIERNASVLDTEFDQGFGFPQMPRFIASDGSHLYMPAQYDGSTWVFRVRCRAPTSCLDEYVGNNEPLPYPGR